MKLVEGWQLALLDARLSAIANDATQRNRFDVALRAIRFIAGLHGLYPGVPAIPPTQELLDFVKANSSERTDDPKATAERRRSPRRKQGP